MISVLTPTYQRYEFLEECIQSYIMQDYAGESEMLVLNDSPLVQYKIVAAYRGLRQQTTTDRKHNRKHIRIVNSPTRFPNLGRKLERGFKECRGDFVVRLDDDDLMVPTALTQIQGFIDNNPGFDVYRFSNFHLFENNKYGRMSEGINNLNTLTRDYINRLEWPDKNADEDLDIIFGKTTTQYTAPNTIGMIYRWRGDGTNISCHVDKPNEERLNFMPTNEFGTIVLHPKFHNDYYGQLPND